LKHNLQNLSRNNCTYRIRSYNRTTRLQKSGMKVCLKRTIYQNIIKEVHLWKA